MSSNNVVLAKNIQVSKLKFSAPKKLQNGSSTVYINYESQKLTLQFPLMSLPYGVGDFNEKNAQNTKPSAADVGGTADATKKYDLHVSFRGMEDTAALKVLHDKMLEIEKRIKEECFNNRLAWLKDDFDGMKNVVDRFFWPIIKYDKDKETGKVVGKYPPTMKLKLPYDSKTDTFQFECQDMDGNEFDFKSNMTKLKGARARLIVQLAGLWFAGGKYGCTWKVIKAKIEQGIKSNVDFIEDSDDDASPKESNSDEDVEEDALEMANASANASAKKTSTLVVDSDEEEEEEDVPPPPVPKKSTKAAPPKSPTPEPVEALSEEENDSELEEEAPPPPPKKAAAKKVVKK